MPSDSWLLEPNADGNVKVTVVKRTGKRLVTEIKADEAGALFTGLATAFRDACIKSGNQSPAESFKGVLPPIEPDAIRVLHPSPDVWALDFRMGEAHILFDMSGLDREGLGRALLASSAPNASAH
ncbi:MAG: hypothetical protein VX871_13315 [Pseudomonadota bacterium]|nr:hypothetical protein [Pseudomonadota bacterium]